MLCIKKIYNFFFTFFTANFITAMFPAGVSRKHRWPYNRHKPSVVADNSSVCPTVPSFLDPLARPKTRVHRMQ